MSTQVFGLFLSRSLVFQISAASEYLPGNVSSSYLSLTCHLGTKLFMVKGNKSKQALNVHCASESSEHHVALYAFTMH